MPEHTPTSFKLRLGAALEDLRVRADLQRKDAAARLSCSEGKIGTIERGEVGVRTPELDLLLDLYGVEGDERADIRHLADQSRRRRPRTPWGSVIPERLKRFFTTEESAVAIQSYLPELLHGLVQTEEYARAVLSSNSALSPDEVEQLVSARVARRDLLKESGPELTLVVPEAVLRSQVGGRAVMKAQLDHLVEISERPTISIRVLETSVGAHAGSGLPFTILTPAQGLQRLVYVETLTDGLFVDDPGRVGRYEVAFWEMTEVALSRVGSRALIATVAREL